MRTGRHPLRLADAQLVIDPAVTRIKIPGGRVVDRGAARTEDRDARPGKGVVQRDPDWFDGDINQLPGGVLGAFLVVMLVIFLLGFGMPALQLQGVPSSAIFWAVEGEKWLVRRAQVA